MKNLNYKILSILVIFAMIFNMTSASIFSFANEFDVVEVETVDETIQNETYFEKENGEEEIDVVDLANGKITTDTELANDEIATDTEIANDEATTDTEKVDFEESETESEIESETETVKGIVLEENQQDIISTESKVEEIIENVVEDKQQNITLGVENDEPVIHIFAEGWFKGSGLLEEDFTKITIQKSDDIINIENSWDIDGKGLMGYVNDKNEVIINCKTKDIIKLESGKDLFSMMQNVVEVKGLGNLDTSETTNIESMFFNMRKLEKVDFEDMDISNVDHAKLLFAQTYNLKNIDLSNFISSKPIHAYSMFYHAGVEKVDLSGRANFTCCEDMFQYCANLKEVSFANSDTTNLEKCHDMFSCCEKLEKIDFTNCDLSNVWQRDTWFYGCDSLQEMIFDGVKFMEDANQIFNGVPAKIISLKNADFSETTCIRKFFSHCKNVEKLDLSYLDFSKVKDANSFIYQCYSLRELDMSGLDFNVFKNTSFNIGLKIIDEWGDFDSMSRYGIPTLKLNNIKLSNKDDLKRLFNTDIASKVEKLEFNGVVLPQDVSNMFSKLVSVKSISLENVDSSKVSNMSKMFANCQKLENVDLSSFDTKKVNNFSGLFENCSNLQNVVLSDLDTTNAVDMSNMFKNCSKLTDLDLSKYNTENLKKTNNMFDGCNTLKTLKMFASKNVDNIDYMFNDCNNLDVLDLSNFETTNIQSVTNFLNNCYGISNLDLSKFTDLSIDMSTLTNLQKITISKLLSNKILDMHLEGRWLDLNTNDIVVFNNEDFNQEGITTYEKTDAVSVTFDVVGGSFMPKVNVSKGSSIKFSEYKDRTKKIGYIVENWYKDKNYQEVISDDYIINEDIIVYAKWVDTPYKVEFVINNDKVSWKSTPSNITRLGAEKYILPTADDLVSNCYDFVGWFDNYKFKYEPILEVAENTFEDKIYYAKFEKKTFKINYELNGGSFDDEVEDKEDIITEYKYGGYVELPKYVKGPNEKDYIKGWYLNPDFTGDSYKIIPSDWYGDKIFYAKYGTRYKIVFECNNESISTQSVKSTWTQYAFDDEEVTLRGIMFAHPWNMYKFIEWHTSDGKVYKDQQKIGYLTEDLYLFAQWKHVGIYQYERVQRTGGSSGGSSGGGGGGGGVVVPQNNNKPLLPNEGLPGYIPLESLPHGNYEEPIPTTTKVDSYYNIKQTIHANDSDAKWVYEPTTGNWSFEKAGQKAQEGFYKITRTDDYLVNGVNVPVYYDLSIYYFDKNGNMVTGWVTDASGQTRFFENVKGITQGMMLRGPQTIQGDTYFFDMITGQLKTNYQINGYYFGLDGKLVVG